MNNSVPQGQMPPGQPAQPAQPAQPFLFQPQQMRNLPNSFSIEEKMKWEHGLSMLYVQMEANQPDSPQYLEARKKIQNFSISLQKKVQLAKLQQQQAAQGMAQPRPQTQGAGAGQGDAAGGQQNRTPVKLDEQTLQHINNFPYALPPTLTAGTPEAIKYLTESKQKYGRALMAMGNTSAQLKALENHASERNNSGNPLNEQELKDFQTKKESFQKAHGEAKGYADRFRKAQEQLQQQNLTQAASGQQNGQQAGNVQRTAMSMNQTAPNIPGQAGMLQRMGSLDGRPANADLPNEYNASAQPMNSAAPMNGYPIKVEGQIKVEPGANQPQINTAIATAPHMRGSLSGAQNSPHSAAPQSATLTGAPKPLTHQAALAHASRTYSSSQTSATPNVMGSQNTLAREAAGPNIQKMPIPKALPPSAIGPPTAVPMQPARPTMSGGPNNSSSGSMGQPALTRPPGFIIEGEAGRVMAKKKLDELVRQVTGGGEGFDSGEGLTPEVEETVLKVADEFVDQVITAACKCAKSRGSKTLEIRDIQLVLERNYNIRIPGYASDEIRTVRKYQPSQSWISKMSAITASKVTGGKSDA